MHQLRPQIVVTDNPCRINVRREWPLLKRTRGWDGTKTCLTFLSCHLLRLAPRDPVYIIISESAFLFRHRQTSVLFLR